MEPKISPLAKKLAKERGVRPEDLVPSGAGNRIVSRDVPEAQPPETTDFPDIDTNASPSSLSPLDEHLKNFPPPANDALYDVRAEIRAILEKLELTDLVQINSETVFKNGRSTQQYVIKISKDVPVGHDGLEF